METISCFDLFNSYPEKLTSKITEEDIKYMISTYTNIKVENLRIKKFINHRRYIRRMNFWSNFIFKVFDISKYEISLISDYYRNSITLDLNKTIGELKKEINDKLKIPIERLQFVLCDNVLLNDDNSSLRFFNPFRGKLSINITEPLVKNLLRVKYPNGEIKNVYTDFLITPDKFINNVLLYKRYDYELYYNNKTTFFNESLLELDIKPGDMIELEKIFKIDVENETGAIIYDLFDTRKDTILSIKDMIHLRKTIPIDKQQLFYNDIELENDKTLEFYGIEKETKLSLKIVDN